MIDGPTHNLGGQNLGLQKITQADFDAMNPARQAIYVDLIKKGQVRIVSADELNVKHDGAKKDRRNDPARDDRGPLSRMKNKTVTILLVNGQALTGRLLEIAQFEIVLTTEGRDLVVLKHAVISAEELKIPEQGPVPAEGSHD
jgi:sRNA-binding regulator protein Hfq